MYRTANIIAASIAAALIMGLLGLMGAALAGDSDANETPAVRQWLSQNAAGATGDVVTNVR